METLLTDHEPLRTTLRKMRDFGFLMPWFLTPLIFAAAFVAACGGGELPMDTRATVAVGEGQTSESSEPKERVAVSFTATVGRDEPPTYSCTRIRGDRPHSRVARGMDPLLTSKAVTDTYNCEFSEPVKRVVIDFVRPGGSDGPPATITAEFEFDPPVRTLDFPLAHPAVTPLSLDIPVGQYRGEMQWTTADGRMQALELDPDRPAIFMLVVDDLRGVQADLDRNRSLWESHGMSDYRFEYEERLFGGIEGPVDVTVEGGAVTSVVRVGGGEVIGAPGFLGSVDNLFDLLQRMVDARSLKVDVEYDPEFGFPRAVVVDQEQAVDDEFEFSVTGFTPAAGG